MKRVIISGAAGFIGSHLADKFIREGYTVVGLDDFSTGNKKNLNQALATGRLKLIECDVTKNVAIEDVKDTVAVIHLAAKKIPRYGNRLKTLETNTLGTASMLRLAKNLKARFLFASTSDVYGMNPELPFSEESSSVIGPSTVARWAYAVSKLYDEHLVFAFHEEYKLPVTILRYFGSYGPRHHRSWWGGPQSVFIDAVLADEPVTIHGDGKQTRSFCYISDTVEATYKAATSPRASNQILNIGNDKEISILDLAALVMKLLPGTKSSLQFVPYQSFTGKKYQDVRRRVPDLTRAKKLLDWEPRVSLKEGLKKTIEWHKQHPVKSK